MRRLLLLHLLLLTAWLGLGAQPADGYYTASTLDGLNGRRLELALKQIVSPHIYLEYNQLWSAFWATDPGPKDSIPAFAERTDLVYDMYANMTARPHFYSENDHTQATGINREHAVPNSWWGGEQGNPRAFTDLHHLVPSDGAANNRKSNYPLGSAAGVTGAKYVSTVNSACRLWSWPKAAGSALGGGASCVWEPSDEYKGDFARMYLYVVCAYEGELTWQEAYNYMFQTNDEGYTDIRSWALEVLLAWHRQDPVSDKERQRNNAVCSIQKNRNPFIDYPELVEYIWGNKAEKKFKLSNAVSAYSDQYQNGSGQGTVRRNPEFQVTYQAVLGKPYTPLRLRTKSNGVITYSSSHPEVAEIDARTGKVTLKAVGTTVITATQAQTNEYSAGRVSYILRVVNK